MATRLGKFQLELGDSSRSNKDKNNSCFDITKSCNVIGDKKIFAIHHILFLKGKEETLQLDFLDLALPTGEGCTPQYKQYLYVHSQRVWFESHFGLK